MNGNDETDDLRRLRAQAEKKLSERMERLKELSSRDISDLVHELGTHQIELEMQNEELRRAQDELEASRSRYAELYDLAPVGYFLIDVRGLIQEANLSGADMLGVPRHLLLGKPLTAFIESGSLPAYEAHRKAAFMSQIRQVCELGMRPRNAPVFYARLQSVVAENVDGRSGLIRIALIDISELKRAEKEREEVIAELQVALGKIKMLTGMLPICMHCKKIRDDQGYWNQLESYIRDHSEAEFSHGLCPECAKKLYPHYFKPDEGK